MFSIFSPAIFVLLVCPYWISFAGAFFEYCDHSYQIDAYKKVFVNSPYYSTSYREDACQYPAPLPCRYPPGSSCRYQLIVPRDFNVFVQCNISLDNAGTSCGSEYFYISIDGDNNLQASEFFCGNGIFQRQSLFNELTIAYTSSSSTSNGWFTCLVEAVPSSLQQDCDCGWSMSAKIAGGTEAKINEFPSMAGIVDSNVDLYQPFCGATIIHYRWSVTAAHCFDVYRRRGGYWNPSHLRLLVGEHDLKTSAETPYTSLYTVYDVIIHSSYRTDGTDYDISLIRLTKDIKYSIGVGPACLPFRWRGFSFTGIPVDITGWGTTSFAGARSTVLQKATVNVVDPKECVQTYGSVFDNSKQICTKGVDKDSCQYDSGGPVYWRNGRQFLLGTISYGKPCGTNEPAVNTRISDYLKWIEYQTQEKYCKVYN